MHDWKDIVALNFGHNIQANKTTMASFSRQP
jgi:hypothetical protein